MFVHLGKYTERYVERKQDSQSSMTYGDYQTKDSYYANLSSKMFIYGITIVILLLIAIGCISCLFTGVASGAFGYSLGTKVDKNAAEAMREYHPYNSEI